MGAPPVRRSKKGYRVTLNLSAIKRRARAGTLSERDRRTVETILPGFLSRVMTQTEAPESRDEPKPDQTGCSKEE